MIRWMLIFFNQLIIHCISVIKPSPTYHCDHGQDRTKIERVQTQRLRSDHLGFHSMSPSKRPIGPGFDSTSPSIRITITTIFTLHVDNTYQLKCAVYHQLDVYFPHPTNHTLLHFCDKRSPTEHCDYEHHIEVIRVRKFRLSFHLNHLLFH